MDEPKSSEVTIQTSRGPVKMLLSSKAAKATGQATAKYWGKVLAALATLACAWLASKTDEILAQRDKRDEDTVRLMAANEALREEVIKLRIKDAQHDQTLEWMRRVIRESRPVTPPTAPLPVPVATVAATDVMSPDPAETAAGALLPIDKIDVSEEKLRAYQQSRK